MSEIQIRVLSKSLLEWGLVVQVRVRVRERDHVRLAGDVRRAVHRVAPDPDAHRLPRPARVQRGEVLEHGLWGLRGRVAEVVVREGELDGEPEEVGIDDVCGGVWRVGGRGHGDRGGRRAGGEEQET